MPNSNQIDTTDDNTIGLEIEASHPGITVVVDQCVIEYLYSEDGSPYGFLDDYLYQIDDGEFDGKASGTFFPTGTNIGTTGGSATYVGATLYGAVAHHDTGVTGNTTSAAFTYGGSEVSGGVAVGLRWNSSAQQGILAFIDSSGPTLRIYEMSSGWTYIQGTSVALTLTSGSTYVLTLADNGTNAAAQLTDDTGVQTCSIGTTLNTGNSQVMVGWMGLTASHTFAAAITGLSATQSGTVAPPGFYVGAGTYPATQSVMLGTSTAGAAVYYTTDGSTPTTSSTLYTGPISVSAATETVKAIAALSGWANSSVASAGYTIAQWTVEYGTIDGSTSGTFALSGTDTGTTSASVVYASTWCAATAYQNISTSNNTVSVTFIYEGPEGGGGVAAGVRWSDSSQEGDLAFLNTNSTPPVLVLYEMSAGWGTGTTTTSLPIALTSGNSYTLTIADDGTTVSASIVGDLGPQSCSITATLSTSNQDVMIGWVGVTASHAFGAAITDVAYSVTPTVSAPTFWPAAGTYTFTQSVTIIPSTPGSAIYYTTDGSTPTTSSTLYTGPITVAASKTVKAIGVLSGWTNSSVASAAYTISVTVNYLNGASGTSSVSVTTSTSAGAMVVMNVQYSLGSGSTAATYAGNAMSAVPGSPASVGLSFNVAQYYLVAASANGTVTFTFSGAAIQIDVYEILGLANNTLDEHSTNSGLAMTSLSATTSAISNANEAAIAALGTASSVSSITWAGTPTFSADHTATGTPTLSSAHASVPTSGTAVDASASWTGSSDCGIIVGVYA